jgi:hypothetical protein
VTATRPQDLRWTGIRYADVDPGCWEPIRRLALMDEDGVDAAIIYPPRGANPSGSPPLRGSVAAAGIVR